MIHPSNMRSRLLKKKFLTFFNFSCRSFKNSGNYFLNYKIWIKIEKLGPFLIKSSFLPIYILPLHLIPCQSTRISPIDLKLYQIPIFDKGFQKNNMRGRSLTVDFFYRRILGEVPLKLEILKS